MRLLLILLLLAMPGWGAYSACVAFTPAGSQVSGGPHTDFTIKINITKNYLKSTGGGGLVTDANAYDVVPHSGSDCGVGNKITTFKVISYNSSTGEIYMHVLRSSFGSSTTTYLGIGDAAITTDQASGSPYDTATELMLAMDNNAASTTVTDYSSNGISAVAAANTSGKSTTGRIGRALTFNGSTDFIDVTHNSLLNNADAGWSVCFWMKQSATTNVPLSKWSGAAGEGYGMYNDDNWYFGSGGAFSSAAASRQSDGAWHYYCLNHDGSNFRSYRNGTAVGGPTAVATPANNTNNLNIGRDNRTGGVSYIAADIDEVEVNSSARSSDWFTTQYNMGTQSTFWSIGSEPGASTRRRIIIVQ